LAKRLDQSSAEVAITIITVQEQMQGWMARVAKAKSIDDQIHAYAALGDRVNVLAHFIQLPWDREAALRFARLRRQGVRIGTMDLRIACIVMEHDALLLTRNFLAPGDEELPQRRKVEWDEATVSRDDLSLGARNSLGSTSALFSIAPETWEEMISVQQGSKPKQTTTDLTEEVKVELAQEKKTLVEKARERLKDRIVSLDDSEMEELLAALLRAMGFRTRVSAKGPDRGVDVLASPDGLGLQEPRIKCEVKHRKNTVIGAQEVRSFLGALRAGDRGIYLSTGGFTREARYESDRATVPLSLMDLDDLARLIETHYETFDTDGRGLLPLTKVFWPADW
jgi:predicted Mrr-cat superfamily restriction endonuclease/predicted nucleic acid-binding protein